MEKVSVHIVIQCFLAAFTSDVTAQLNSREKGGASDTKTQTYTT